MRQTGEMNPEGGARWYASETCFRLYSLLMTNGQEKEGRHEKCPYVDVKYVVSGTMWKENQNRYWPTFGAGIRAGVPAGRATLKNGRPNRPLLRRLRRIPDGRTYLSRKGSPQTGMHYARPSSFSKETGFGALTHLLPEPGDGLRIR